MCMHRTAGALAAIRDAVLLDVDERLVQCAACAGGARPPGPTDDAHVAGGVDADVREGEEHVPLLAAALQPWQRRL
jgi:hypothetical protein